MGGFAYFITLVYFQTSKFVGKVSNSHNIIKILERMLILEIQFYYEYSRTKNCVHNRETL